MRVECDPYHYGHAPLSEISSDIASSEVRACLLDTEASACRHDFLDEGECHLPGIWPGTQKEKSNISILQQVSTALV